MAVKQAGAGGRSRFGLGQNSDMNVTPFVDVMLVLLIIFMVAAPLATTAIKINIPPPQPNGGPPPSYVSLAGDGQIYVSIAGGAPQRSSLAGLGGDLARWLGGDPAQARLFIRADQHVPYGRFMAVMDRLHDDGYVRVGLISEEVQPGA